MEVLRVSRVVQLILDAELEPAKGLGVLVDQVLESGMSRYQFIDALLELSSALEHWPGLADQEDEGHAGIWASGNHRAVRPLCSGKVADAPWTARKSLREARRWAKADFPSKIGPPGKHRAVRVPGADTAAALSAPAPGGRPL